MKFVATEDIRAPIDHVWATVTDFDRFEGMLSKRSQSLDRQPKGPVTPGTRWTGRAVISGKKRDVSAVLATLDPGSRMVVEGGTDGMRVTVDTVVEAKGPELTRLTVVTEAKARTLAARLLLQSAKLARGTLAKRYKARVGAFAERVEGALAD